MGLGGPPLQLPRSRRRPRVLHLPAPPPPAARHRERDPCAQQRGAVRGPAGEGGDDGGDGGAGQGREAAGVPEGQGDHPGKCPVDGGVGPYYADDEEQEKGTAGKV